MFFQGLYRGEQENIKNPGLVRNAETHKAEKLKKPNIKKNKNLIFIKTQV